jgi:NHS family xanthosine MFS transporter
MWIQGRLAVMNFLQFFVWGAWLISLGGYLIVTLGFTGGQVGSIYATMGIGALFMPGLLGIVADRWLNAERLYGILHLTGAGLLCWAATVKDFETLHVIMLMNAMCYMPTIALNNAVSYTVLEQRGLSIVEKFPPIRVWGTVGFIIAMWTVDFAGWTKSALQLYVSAGRRSLTRSLRIHDAEVPAGARHWKAQHPLCARARCIRAVPAPAAAGVLHIRGAARRCAADH